MFIDQNSKLTDGQQFWLSKTALKYALIEKTKFEIPYIKANQFRKSHFAIYLSLFSDFGYIIDSQNIRSFICKTLLTWTTYNLFTNLTTMKF